MTFDVDQAVELALTPKGSGRLSFQQMMSVLKAGRARNLPLSAIDATCEDGTLPSEHGFYVDLNEMEDAGETRIAMAEKSFDWPMEYYSSNGSDYADDEFEVWFRP
jgi:hypothetical protein